MKVKGSFLLFKVEIVLTLYTLIAIEREFGKVCLYVILAHATFNPSICNLFIPGGSKGWEVVKQGLEEDGERKWGSS